MIFLFGSEAVWRIFAHVWMVSLMGTSEADLLLGGKYSDVVTAIAMIYVAVLSIYAGTKEFSRWNQLYKSKRHPGEIAVFIWTCFMLFLFLEKSLFKPDYIIPSALVSAYIAALTIFALTLRSKAEYERSDLNGVVTNEEAKTDVNEESNLSLESEHRE